MKENVNHFLILFIFLGKEGDSKRDETRVETNIYYQGKKYRNIAQGSFHFRTHNMRIFHEASGTSLIFTDH